MSSLHSQVSSSSLSSSNNAADTTTSSTTSRLSSSNNNNQRFFLNSSDDRTTPIFPTTTLQQAPPLPPPPLPQPPFYLSGTQHRHFPNYQAFHGAVPPPPFRPSTSSSSFFAPPPPLPPPTQGQLDLINKIKQQGGGGDLPSSLSVHNRLAITGGDIMPTITEHEKAGYLNLHNPHQQQQHSLRSSSLSQLQPVPAQPPPPLPPPPKEEDYFKARRRTLPKSTELPASLAAGRRPSKDDMDLIDLGGSGGATGDDFGVMSVIEMFDPLVAKIRSEESKQQQQQQQKQQEETAAAVAAKEEEKEEQPKTSRPAPAPATTRRRDTVKAKPAATTTPPQGSKKKQEKAVVESLRIVDLDAHVRHGEFRDFEQAVNDMHCIVEAEHKKLAHLAVFSPQMEYPILNRNDVKVVVRYHDSISAAAAATTADDGDQLQQQQSQQQKRHQVIITPSINATVETLVYEVLLQLNINDLNTEKYLLKIHGLEEYLPIDACLADLKYIHECLIEGKEPTLVLVEVKNVNTELSGADSSPSRSVFTFKQPTDKNVHLMSKSKLEAALKSLALTRKLLSDLVRDESNSSDTNVIMLSQLDKVLNLCINLKEKVRHLTALIYHIHYAGIETHADRLEMIEKSLCQIHVARQLGRETQTQPLMSMSNLNYTDHNGDTALQLLYASMVEISSELLHAVVGFANCAAVSFYWPFRLEPVYQGEAVQEQADEEEREQTEIIQIEEKVVIQYNGLSRLHHFLSQLKMNPLCELFLKFSICYGTRVLDMITIKLDRLDRLRQIHFYNTSHRIQFDKVALCQLPREAILTVQLCAWDPEEAGGLQTANTMINSNYAIATMPSSINSMSVELSSTSTTNRRGVNLDAVSTCLAWCSKSFFDDNLTLQTGTFFMCFFPGECPQIGTSASNIYTHEYPVIQIDLKLSDSKFSFMNNRCTFVYPQVTDEPECVLKDFQKLSVGTRERLLYICNKSIVASQLTEEEKDLLRTNYLSLNGIPNALAKIFLSFPAYDYSSIINYYSFIKQYESLSLAESLELLLPYFPEVELRNVAVRSLHAFSAETILLYLPQLLEALKYERCHDSSLMRMLLLVAAKNIRFAHRLYWQLREFKARQNECLVMRYELLYQAMLYFFNKPMLYEVEQEVFLVQRIDQIASKKKELKDNERLHYELDALLREWPLAAKTSSCRLPYNISFCTRDIDIKSCSYLPSFTMPLKLVFRNVDPSATSFYTIYKVGDDLRQDMFVLQLINVMNQLWLKEDHDLCVLTFTCLQTGDKRGFVEMITNAETLKEIQKGQAINAFKMNSVNDWLRSHNPNQANFMRAVRNFTKSCAAYSVATYILGIGDRHNDNVMVKYTGHMFHIDFGKYLGDAQTFAGIKRDRTAILFTPDMFYAINQSKSANERFQDFIYLCCKAFQILRSNYHHLLTLIDMMIDSGIPGLNRNAIQYVYRNLMLELTEDEASQAFTKLVYDSLSKLTSLNHFIHTIAQPKTSTSYNYFSFIDHTYNANTDGKIISINLMQHEQIHKDMFKILVKRTNDYESNEVNRSFKEFCELYQLLLKTFPTLKLPATPSINKFTNARSSLEKRQYVELLLADITKLQPEISQSEIIYTFFHSILRDQKQTPLSTNDLKSPDYDESRVNFMLENFGDPEMVRSAGDIRGQIQVKLKFKDNKFLVNCIKCRNLRPPHNQPVSSLKPYVKCYLRPDYTKATKKKVQALYNGANPIFTETMEYDLNLFDLRNRTLEISVLNNKLNNKERIGTVQIPLDSIKLDAKEFIKWYDLR